MPNSGKPKTIRKTPKLSDLVNKNENEEKSNSDVSSPELNTPYTEEQLKNAWDEFAEQRKLYQAEYQLLTQAYERKGDVVIVHLHNPIQETILSTLKSDITGHLRDRLRNSSINVVGEFREEDTQGKKVFYTPKEKFEYLIEKNPILKELKERLGLDPDF